MRCIITSIESEEGHPNVQSVFQPGGTGAKRVCVDILTGDNETFSPMDEPGLIYFECYRDIQIHPTLGDTDGDGVDDQTNVISNEILFPDPGVYQVKLSMMGYRWNADDLTFEDDSSGVTYEVTEAIATYTINVKPRQIKGDGYVTNVGILNRFHTGELEAYPQDSSDPYINKKKIELFDDDYMIVSENTGTPLVASATIDFFQGVDKRYINPTNATNSNLMQKFNGVGSWDYNYPGDNNPGGSNDKRDFHPPNWNKDGVGKILEDAGNDATNDYVSNYARDSDGNKQTIFEDNVEHIQGTYSSDSYYSGTDMSDSMKLCLIGGR